MLVRHNEPCDGVKHKLLGEVSGEVTSKDLLRDCEEGQVLNIRVVFDGVADDVVHIVRPLPPSQTDSPWQVGKANPHQEVPLPVVEDPRVPKVMPIE